MQIYTEKKTWWVLNDLEVVQSEGLNRGGGYWWFQKLGYSIDESCLFNTKQEAKNALIRKLKKTILFYEEKLEKAQNDE